MTPGTPLRLLAAVLSIVPLSVETAAAAVPSTPCSSSPTTLILYDTSGEFGYLGERYATMAANLVSRFGEWEAEPVVEYQAGQLACAKAAIYFGSTYREPIPTAFLDDVAAGGTPIMWVWENLDLLAGRLPVEIGDGPDGHEYTEVTYQGRSFSRNAPVDAGLSTQSLGTSAEVLATASGPEIVERPWATRIGDLMYLAENPLTYISGTDRYLVFNDLLFELIAPDTPERHRALVRLEDVSPAMDPALLSASVEALIEERVPFAIALIPEYHDGKGGPVIRLRDRPKLLEVLRRAVENDGTLILHGVTHQVDGLDNPYNGETAADYEFFQAIVDEQDYVRLVGPVPGSTYESTKALLERGIAEFVAAGLPRPQIITPPHYAASADAYRAMSELFAARFDRGLYFDGQLSTGVTNPTSFYDQFFTYPITDVHGMTVVPENLGNESPEMLNNHPVRGVDDLIAGAEASLAVRDGFAAFFWHPYLVAKEGVGVEHLHQIVQGIKALGYTFVGLDDVVPEAGAYLGEVPPKFELPDIRPYQVLAVALAIWLPMRWWRRNRGARATAAA